MREIRRTNHSDVEQIFKLYKNEGWQSFSKNSNFGDVHYVISDKLADERVNFLLMRNVLSL